ncbi:hypothetical protein BWQ96_07210 [Gracilariopsis chorda]|uniref:Uncharacterized protein n=1 Tax=Gracilariopsis chorda TaxID=448386 RepID=A0A2V3ILY2_9FLOR|nr:hypothetical protein BWQ96_07210 [Gracilariopsis chorda]|eukprot:PXF43063.1 hypothetical protein BWQ96_07210 [Gracilariopsis chorda]
MLITDLELRHGAKKVEQFEYLLKHVVESRSKPALFRLQLRLPHASSFLDEGESLFATLDIHNGEWTRVSRLDVNIQSSEDQPFEHEFTARDSHDLRIQFWHGSDLAQPKGQLLSNLHAIAMATHERMQMSVAGLPRSRDTAELSLKWITPDVEKLIINVQIHINKKEGWPFSNARPYFVVYCWKSNYSLWNPIYRSEVMTKRSIPPCSKRAMKFIGAMIKMDGKSVDKNQASAFRIEFFHYKTTGIDKILGSYPFDLRQLRQLEPGNQRLNMRVSNFEEGHLVGDLRLIDSKLEYGKSTFTFDVEFGGDVGKDFVYLDLEVLNSSPSSIGRVSFEVSTYTPQGAWETFFSSERSHRLKSGESYRFDVAKFLERKLMNNRNCCPLGIKWYIGKEPGRRMCGSILIMIPDVLEKSSGDMLPLQECEKGLIRIENLEKTTENGTKIHLGLCFVYGAQMLTPDGGQADEPPNASAMAEPWGGMLERPLFHSQGPETEESPSNDSS